MPRYVAFLRGVSPQNARQAELRACFEAAGFTRVATVLGSGNVLFDARTAPVARLQQKAEAAMQAALAHPFVTTVRAVAELEALLDADPWAAHPLPASAKRVLTFLRDPQALLPPLPIVRDGVHILASQPGVVFSAYEPSPNNPVFMVLLEKTFGKGITTRTLDTVRRCIAN